MKLSEIIADLQRKLHENGDFEYGGYTIVPVEVALKYEYKKEQPISVQPQDTLVENEDLSDDSFSARMELCKKCPEISLVKIAALGTEIHRCNKCGCLMELKSRIKFMHCPLGKW